MVNPGDSILRKARLFAVVLLGISSICSAQSTGWGLWSGLLVRERSNQPGSTVTSTIVWLRYEVAF
jgi:hypothetical protein